MSKHSDDSVNPPDVSIAPSGPDSSWAFSRYEQIRPRLPVMPALAGRAPCEHQPSLLDLFEHFDAFVLDGFGVLNVGEAPVDTAAERLDQMRAAGKIIMVITNGSTQPAAVTAAKYRGWNLGLADEQVISSRDALEQAMTEYPATMRWGVAAPENARLETLSGQTVRLTDDEASWQNLDGFVLLSSLEWNDARQTRLHQALAEQPRPLLIGNPDLVAPREDRFSLEPGYYGHRAADAAGVPLRLFGKPAPEVFAMAQARIDASAGRAVPGARIAMVGDSLHTDVLGAAAFGWRSVLVLSHGLFRDQPIEPLIEASGIAPDFCVHHT